MPPSATSPGRMAVEQQRLDGLVVLLEELITGPSQLSPCLLAVADVAGGDVGDEPGGAGGGGAGGDQPADQGELCIMPITGDPYAELAMAHFRPGTWAVGIVIDGWAASATDVDVDGCTGTRPSQAPDRVRSHSVVLVAASGAQASCTVLDDGRRITEMPTGAMAQALRTAARRAVRADELLRRRSARARGRVTRRVSGPGSAASPG